MMNKISLNKLSEGKKLVGYGAGLSLLGTQVSTPVSLEYLVDDTPGLAGQKVCGLPVYSPARLREERKEDILVIIYANAPQSIMAISSSLNSMGFIWGTHYIDCSLLHYKSINQRLQEQLGIEIPYKLFSQIRVLSLYSALHNLSYIAGSWLYVGMLEQCCSDVAGGIAECGVYNGGNALIALQTSESALQRPYHLLDSFEGFPALSKYDLESRKNDFGDVNFDKICDLFGNFDNAYIHKGYFDKTLPSLEEQQFCMVYIDCDLYEGALDCCNYFYNRIPEGGCLMFHDYWVPEETLPHAETFKGVNKAVKEFLGSEIYRLIVFPETTHALLIKK